MDRLGIEPALGPSPQRGEQVADRTADWRSAVRIVLFVERDQPGDQRVGFLVPPGQLDFTLGGNRKSLARAGVGLFRDHTLVEQQAERGIDHAGTGRVIAPGQLLDSLDQLIPMAGFIADQLEQKQPQLAACEHPPTWAPPSAATATWAAFAVAEAPFPRAAATASTACAHRHRHHRPAGTTSAAAFVRSVHAHVRCSFRYASKMALRYIL